MTTIPERQAFGKNGKNRKAGPYRLDSTINTSIGHYQGLTIQEIIDRDSNGDNIVHLLRYRAAGDGKMTEEGYPFNYLNFSTEVNATLDTFLYASPKLLEKFKPRYSKGQLMLKLKEIAAENKLRKEREIKEFQEQERNRMDEFLQAARAEEQRKAAYSDAWGKW